jgi:hypothetical protein
MTIKTLDKVTLGLLRTAINSALEQVGKEHGVKISLGKCTFLPENATFKLEVATIGEDGDANIRMVADFKNYCESYGLKPEHLGAKITFGGEQYELAGLASGRSWKNPFILRRPSDGKLFKAGESAVESLTGKSKTPVVHRDILRGYCQHRLANGNMCENQFTTIRKVGKKVLNMCDGCAELHDEAVKQLQAQGLMA